MRPSVIVATLSMLAACGGLAYYHAERQQQPNDGVATVHASQTASAEGTASDTAPTNAEKTNANSANTEKKSASTASDGSPATAAGATSANPETVAQWIKDTESLDAKTRADAIAALADAPPDQALPALKRVLQVGEPNVDRQIALRSIYTLALRDGDSNGTIRDVMRGAIYHNDDDGVTQTAQSLLDDIEAEFSGRATSRK